MLRILVRNIVSNWVGFAIRVIVVFFLTPFVVHSLGDTRYGVWALVTSFTGYYGLLDVGLRAGITQYLTRHLATEDFDELNRTASTAFAALAGCAALVGFVSLGIAWIAPIAFTIPRDTIGEAQWCIVIVGLTTGLQFTFYLYSSVLAATQRYDLLNVVGITVRLVTTAAVVVALQHGYGLVTLCGVNAAGVLVSSLAQWRIAARILPQMRIVHKLVTWASLRPIASFGIWSFLIQNATTFKWGAGSLIIGIFMPVSALTPYSLALGLIIYFNAFFQSMAGVFLPAATRLDAQGDMRRLRKMYLMGSKVLVLLAIPLTLIGVMWAKDFYRLWVGERFVTGEEFSSVALLFWLLVFAAFVTAVQRIGNQVLEGTRRLKQLASVAVGETIASVLVGILLVQTHGLLGVTLGVLISAIVFQGVMRPIVVCRAVGISATEYLQSVWLRPCAVGVSVFLGLGLLKCLLPAANNWPLLILSGVCAAILTAGVLVLIGLNTSERQQFLIKPWNQLRLQFAAK